MTERPPGGTPPPTAVELAGLRIDLSALAIEICERYHQQYPDDIERRGAVSEDWCHHDNQWLLSWAASDVLGVTKLDEQACWLARVLHNRGFPVERLAHNLRIAADVVGERVGGDSGRALAERLERAGDVVLALNLSRGPH